MHRTMAAPGMARIYSLRQSLSVKRNGGNNPQPRTTSIRQMVAEIAAAEDRGCASKPMAGLQDISSSSIDLDFVDRIPDASRVKKMGWLFKVGHPPSDAQCAQETC